VFIIYIRNTAQENMHNFFILLFFLFGFYYTLYFVSHISGEDDQIGCMSALSNK